jgi:hypothetical protein
VVPTLVDRDADRLGRMPEGVHADPLDVEDVEARRGGQDTGGNHLHPGARRVAPPQADPARRPWFAYTSVWAIFMGLTSGIGNDGPMIGTLRAVALDAEDAPGLAAFYAELGGWGAPEGDAGWTTVRAPGGWRIAAQGSPGHVPPRWPDPAHPQQAHLDLRVADLGTGTARAVGLGATLLRENESWNTLADPAGHPFDLCRAEDAREITVAGVMLDCPDAKRLSGFYAELLGKPVTYENDGMAMIGEPDAQPIMFQQVGGYVAPRWPDPAFPQQLHLDVTVEDVEAGEAAVLKLGATSLGAGGDNWRVYADPAGKPFCLCWD